MGHSRSRTTRRTRAFSLVELVIVVVIMGIIGAIAIPRFSRAGEGARMNALIADLSLLQSAVDRYTTEHGGLSPGHDAPGVASGDGDELIERLLETSDDAGNVDEAGYLGPYLRKMPPNPYNGLSTVRIGGGAAGANTHGWRFDPASFVIQSDHGEGKDGGSGGLDVGVVDDDLADVGGGGGGLHVGGGGGGAVHLGGGGGGAHALDPD